MKIEFLLIYLYNYNTNKMKDEFQKRKTKKDKQQRNFELYGKYSPKHIRMKEKYNEKKQITNDKNDKNDKNNKNL